MNQQVGQDSGQRDRKASGYGDHDDGRLQLQLDGHAEVQIEVVNRHLADVGLELQSELAA